MNMTFKLCKNRIERNMYESQEEMQFMLDVFYAGNRINADEYRELTAILESKHEVA